MLPSRTLELLPVLVELELTLAEVEETRKKSRSWGPDKVRDCPEWYGCKTATRRLLKLLPKNPKLASRR